MLKVTTKIVISVLIAFGLLMPGLVNKAEAKSKKKVGFFTRMVRHVKRDVKRNVKKTKRAIVKTGAAIENGVVDGAVKAKSALTGKKSRKVWVTGHYKKGNKSLTNGHFTRVCRHKKGSGSSSSAPVPSNPAPTTPGVSTGNPLPPVDPALPSMSKSTKARK